MEQVDERCEFLSEHILMSSETMDVLAQLVDAARTRSTPRCFSTASNNINNLDFPRDSLHLSQRRNRGQLPPTPPPPPARSAADMRPMPPIYMNDGDTDTEGCEGFDDGEDIYSQAQQPPPPPPPPHPFPYTPAVHNPYFYPPYHSPPPPGYYGYPAASLHPPPPQVQGVPLPQFQQQQQHQPQHSSFLSTQPRAPTSAASPQINENMTPAPPPTTLRQNFVTATDQLNLDSVQKVRASRSGEPVASTDQHSVVSCFARRFHFLSQ